VGYDHSCAYFFTGNLLVEIADHGEYHFRNFRKNEIELTCPWSRLGGCKGERCVDAFAGTAIVSTWPATEKARRTAAARRVHSDPIR
jgi:hypothetical protein